MAMSTPETPSTSAWWVLESSAKRPSASPSTSHSSHNARERSSGWEKTRPARRLEFVVATRTRQRGVAYMEAGLEVRVVDPHRSALIERHEGQALAVARHEVQARIDLLEQVFVARRRPLEHHAAGHVHVGGVALEMQERAVQTGEAIAVGHARILARGPRSSHL